MADVAQIIRETFPGLRVDEKALVQELVATKSSAAHYYRRDGDSLLVAVTSDLPFSSKKQSTIVLWLGDGRGVELMLDYLRWVDKRKAIRVSCFTPTTDRNWARIMPRFGFTRHGGMYARVKGV